ncbi:MAG: outer membrane lipoprotein-sorting protein [candidate division Zixibacteria bacterium]|nr:outer membrane lipoprotein-sorting protein [candidate division Zixibacteria bacterium]
MKTLTLVFALSLLGLSMFSSPAVAQDAAGAEGIMKQAHLAYYYAGDDGLADVTMRIIDKKGKERERQFVMLRLDLEEGGNQKYYTYFKKPSDVSRMTFMVHKSDEGNDKRWIYVPAVDLVKPISADDKNSSFVGSNFSYEDVSGRHWTEDNHTLVQESELDGHAVYVIESVPKVEYGGFAKKVSYIDKDRMLPLKEEYFDKKGTMVKIFRAEKIEDVDGILTVTLRSMEDLKKGGKTYVDFSQIDYNVGLTDDLFTERYLKNPPREFVN